MKLRTKTLLATAAAVLTLAVLLAAASSRLLGRGFAEIEERDGLRNVARAVAALEDEAQALSTTAGDYAGWDDTCAFLAARDAGYLATNYNDETFVKLRLNLVALLDSQGSVAYAKAFDLARRAEVPLSEGARAALLSHPGLARHATPESDVSGLVLLPEGPMLVASRPIVTSEYKGPVRGALLMGRYLTEGELGRVARRTRLTLGLRREDDPVPAPAFRLAGPALVGGDAGLVPQDEATLLGFARLRDVDGKPAALLRLALPRDLHAQGRATMLHLVVTLVALAVSSGAAVLILLEKFILARLGDLSAQVAQVGRGGSSPARIRVEGNDELSTLGHAINDTLAGLEAAQTGLRDGEARYRAVVEQLAEGIVLADAGTQRLIEANQAFLRLAGARAAELDGLSLLDVLGLERRELERGVREARQGAWRLGERTCRRRDGSGVEVMASAHVVTHGSRDLLCVVVSDITERKAAEDEVRRANEDLERRVRDRTSELTEAYSVLQSEVEERVRAQEALEHRDEQLRHAQKMEAVGRLAGGVAHDFNNLLTAISSYAELLIRHLEGQERLQRYARGIEQTADRAAGLTRQLLAFSRRQVLSPEPLSLDRVIAGLEPMLRRLIGEDVELVTAPAPDLWTVRADRGQVEQVLLNLVVNARDAMPRGGRLTVEASNVTLGDTTAALRAAVGPGDYVQLCVTDTGVGMDAETLRRAFEPFFTTKGVGAGTGLGLATVYGIAAQSGGGVWASSEPGRGSRFTVYLPRDGADAPDAGREVAPERAPGARPGGGETILLAEDEETVRLPLAEGLRAKGYTLLEATDGEQALDVARGHAGRIDLLLTDVVMPRRGGRELAESLRAERPGLRVLYMSGYPNDAVVRAGVLEAAVSYLAKPFSVETLARKVREVLDREDAGTA